MASREEEFKLYAAKMDAEKQRLEAEVRRLEAGSGALNAEKADVERQGRELADGQAWMREQLDSLAARNAALEQKLLDALGTKVSIRGTAKQGRIEISYFSMDDLERIFEIIVPPDRLI